MQRQFHASVRKFFRIFFFLVITIFHSDVIAQEKMAQVRICVPIADLRKEPVRPSSSVNHDPLEESQLLYGDPVEILEGTNGWIRVAAVEQQAWSHHRRWEGYPGWVENSTLISQIFPWNPNLIVTSKWGRVRENPIADSHLLLTLSIGTRLMGEDDGTWWKVKLLDGRIRWISGAEVTPMNQLESLRQNKEEVFRTRLVNTARLFLNDPYYWGGRTAYNPGLQAPPNTAVDCSGFTGLVYQANGITIPRDAHEQWMRAHPISKESLAPGDLVFLSEDNNPKRITHVMLFLGSGQIIEAPGTGRRVREMSVEKRLEESPERSIFYGTYLD